MQQPIKPSPPSGQFQIPEEKPKITLFRLIRKLIFWFFFSIILFYVILHLSAPFLKIKIQDYFEKALNTDVTITDIGINLFTRSIIVENLQIKNPTTLGDKIFFTTERISIKPAILPFLNKKIIIERIAIENPCLNLYNSAENQNNWDFIWKNRKDETPADNKTLPINPAPSNGPLESTERIILSTHPPVNNVRDFPARGEARQKRQRRGGINEFLIKNGRIKYVQDFDTEKKAGAELDGIFIYIKNYRRPQEYIKNTPLYTIIKGRGYLPTQPKGSLSFEGNMNIFEKDPSFLGNISMENISLTYFNDFYPDKATIQVINGHFSLQTKIDCLQGKLNARPDVTIKELQLKLTKDYSTTNIFKLPVMLVIDFFDIYKEELQFSFAVSGTLDDPEFHLAEIVQQEISTMIGESIVRTITTTPHIAEKLGESIKSLGTTMLDIGKDTKKAVGQIGKPIKGLIKGIKNE